MITNFLCLRKKYFQLTFLHLHFTSQLSSDLSRLENDMNDEKVMYSKKIAILEEALVSVWRDPVDSHTGGDLGEGPSR